MNWVPLDINNLPEQEVLAANFKPGTYGFKEKLLGYLHADETELDCIICESGDQVLENCTHYIDINLHDIT